LVEAHGSAVAAVSEGADRGATFSVHIPSSDVRPASSLPDVESGQPTLVGVRVLIVEDDEDARGLLNRVLTSAEARVCEAEDVRGALDALESFQPNLVVSDIGIPGQDGYDLIREIRARGFDATRLPAIALTAFARSEDRDRALRAGYQRHLSKPVDVGQLVRAATSLTRNGGSDRRE
jgi:CheY-like chemotaxis protein